MDKKCSVCKQLRPIEEYNNDTTRNDGKQSSCKYCNRGAQKRYRNKKRSEVQDIKDKTPCFDCGIQYPYYVMQFDHLPEFEKKFNIAKQINSATRKQLFAEMEKCEVVCANCHAERSWNRQIAGKGNSE